MLFDGVLREYAANIGVTFKVPEDVFGYAQLPHEASPSSCSDSPLPPS